jgi:H+-translocating NAD(P) transhydrogenase subunit beta
VTPAWAQLGYLVAAVCFIVALKGLSSPRTARRGNVIGAAGALLACVIVFLASDIQHLLPILAAIAAGTAIGVLGAYRVQMTRCRSWWPCSTASAVVRQPSWRSSS